MTTDTNQIQGSTIAELIDRLAAIDATADHNGGLKQSLLRERHNITDEIRRRVTGPCRTCGNDCARPQVCPNFALDWTPTKENS
jgi:hypothetical protein